MTLRPQQAQFGRNRPQLDPPRFTQHPSHPGSKYQDFPTGPGRPPYRARLQDLVKQPPDTSKKLVFHIAGDTGGVKDPHPQQIVADAMEADAEKPDPPAFFYHLGDVIYYNGESSEYYPQFYLPYEHYPEPVLGLAGNHDGDPLLTPDGKPVEPSLSAWVRNFCSPDGALQHEAGDTPRHAMQQPNPYWTLLTEQATFIGLYTNVPEGGEVRQEQHDWFVGELKAADQDKAIFVCLHHPVFSADAHHSGSPAMKALLDDAVQKAGVHPDLVFSGHVHNYQRFTRRLEERERPYIVAGAGGYWHLHAMARFQGAKVTTPFRQKDDESVVLEKYVDDTHGFLRVEVEANLVTCRYFAVARPHDPPGTPARVADYFQVKLKENKLVR